MTSNAPTTKHTLATIHKPIYTNQLTDPRSSNVAHAQRTCRKTQGFGETNQIETLPAEFEKQYIVDTGNTKTFTDHSQVHIEEK